VEKSLPVIAFLSILLALASPAHSAEGGSKVDFTRDVFPILKAKCLKCHGPKRQRSEFRLDTRAAVLEGGDSGEPGVVPGKSAKSAVYQRLVTDNREARMPPTGDPLDATTVATLRAWIDQGATMPERVEIEKPETGSGEPVELPDHWSFRPLSNPEPPDVLRKWRRNEVDQFIGARLEKEGLKVSDEADREALIRRIYLILHGLPPTSEEIETFIRDTDVKGTGDRAWGDLVDRALASPRFGERWARHWLDLVRFGETTGFEVNRERPNAWHYRDWVIDSFHRDKPYDQFLREQIAGDALGADVGTGFLVAGPFDQVKSPDINLTLMQRQDELADIINTTGTAFLGLTLGCARCHDHKFDPISQKDYYAIQAVFAGVQHGERPFSATVNQPEKIGALRTRATTLRASLAKYLDVATDTHVWIEDASKASSNSRGIEALHAPKGGAEHRAGVARGFQSDPGGEQRSANVSDGRYTWWENRPSEFLVSYRLLARGRFRVWASWGIGFPIHSSDVEYVLDRDGDLASSNDQVVLAKIDQQAFANGDPAKGNVPLWSGLRDLGVHEVGGTSVLAIRGGKTGTAVTADLVVLEPATGKLKGETRFSLRPKVNSKHNVETFAAIEAKFVRFTIEATNSSEPCIDELEIFSGEKNVALAKNGAKATSSGDFPNNAFHKLEHIFDGRYGNSYSWISSQTGRGWVEIELPEPVRIDRIEWARDRELRYRDRVPTAYRIEAGVERGKWTRIASSADRIPFSAAPPGKIGYRFDLASAEEGAKGEGLLASLEGIEKQIAALEKKPVAYIGTFRQPGPTHRLYRGEPLQKREEVSPDTVAAFGKLALDAGASERDRRIAFAKWVTREDNPLTARVIVNRLWQHVFGVGIVDTPSDFGLSGTRPVHPELLDWLAGEMVRSKWSIKHVLRVMLLSKTFRQSGRPRVEGLRLDADSRLLWRFPPRRLEAEAIRDSILFTSGVLDLRMGGPGFSAFEVQMENVRHYFPKKSYGPSDWRRMIYMTKVRQEQDSVFGAFDCPDASQVMPKRSRSTTPLQALNLFNSRFVLQQAGLFAERLREHAPEKIAQQVAKGFRLAFGRNVSDEELADAIAFVEEHGLEAFCRALLNANEFVFIL